MNNPRVFELAKELGIDTIALMDKIKKWELPVKNHMMELDEAIIQEIRDNLKKEDKKKQKKKNTNKTKAAIKKKSDSTSKKNVKKIKSSSLQQIVVKSKEDASAVPKTKVVKSKKVIRRKSTKTKPESDSAKPVKPLDLDDLNNIDKENISIKKEELKLKQDTENVIKEEILSKEKEEITSSPKIEKTETIKKTETAEIIEKKANEVLVKQEENIAKEKVENKLKKKISSRKKEVTIGASGLISQAQPEIDKKSKKNIVGKIDLKSLKSKPNESSSNMKDITSSRAARGNIRTGFISQDDFTKEYEEEKAKKEKEAKKVKGEVRTEETSRFASSDFRKREMVFQPKKKKIFKGEGKKTQITVPKASKRILKIHNSISLSDLAIQMGVKSSQLIKKLMQMGEMVNINSSLDFDTVSLLVSEFGFEAVNIFMTSEELIERNVFGDLDVEKVSRPPIVTIMGHVDHGKTTLLDVIRKTDIANKEAGGITQHIGAYSVEVSPNKKVTFIDTPGHEAFTNMRARGANITDIAIIVVAADDGVMPQTIEAINHAKAAGVTIMVAINKIDKPGANVDKIKQQLTEYELVSEDWGGNIIFSNVSAKNKKGINELLESILLVADILELKANPKRSATGIVIESKQEKGRGNVSTFLVKEGTLSVGQYVNVGLVKGKIRGLLDDKGQYVDNALPGIPVEVLGLDGIPQAGDKFDICKDEKTLNEINEMKIKENKIEKLRQESKDSLSIDDLFSKIKNEGVKELPIILKADVFGSIEAIINSFENIKSEEVKIKVIHSGVGAINESDILLASTSGALVIGFNVRPDGGAQNISKNKGISILLYSVIYNLIEDIKKSMQGLLEPEILEKDTGRLEVRNVFSVSKVGTIAGCFIVDGKVFRNNLVRLIRDGRVVYKGKIDNLKRFKDDVKEVASGFECGLSIENFNDIKVGDVVEAYEIEKKERELK